MSQSQKRGLNRVLLALGCYIIVLIWNHFGMGENGISFPNIWTRVLTELLPYIAVYLLAGWKVLKKAISNISKGQVFDENFLMCIASIGAFAIGEYSEAVAVMIFYQIGEWFEHFAVERSRNSITAMMDICPEYANLWRDGELVQVDPDEVSLGDRILVKPGEKIPLDGVVLDGKSFVDTSALTGEPVPRKVNVGDNVISGCVNKEGTLTIEVSKLYEDSTVVKILELVENASSKKAKVENFITKFAKYYTPVVVIAAVLMAVIPSVTGMIPWTQALRSACIFLVISCPCALVISVPLSFFGGIGAASKAGILIKGSNYIEAVSKLSTIIFDKTGTLTKGDFKVVQILPQEGYREEEVLEVAAYGEGMSNHPIALSIREAYGKPLALELVEQIKEIPGIGISGFYQGKEIQVGNVRLLEEGHTDLDGSTVEYTTVYVLKEKKHMGTIYIADELKPTSKQMIKELKELGINHTVMLTGDREQVAQVVGNNLGLDQIFAELLPQDKLTKTEEILAQKGEKESVAFVGDGMNDAPVLARVDVGIAMGSLGSDAAIEAADVVLMDDDPIKIGTAIRISRKTMKIVKQNIILALGVKFCVMILGVIGVANMWEAVFADVGVSVLAIMNAMRTLRFRR